MWGHKAYTWTRSLGTAARTKNGHSFTCTQGQQDALKRSWKPGRGGGFLPGPSSSQLLVLGKKSWKADAGGGSPGVPPPSAGVPRPWQQAQAGHGRTKEACGWRRPAGDLTLQEELLTSSVHHQKRLPPAGSVQAGSPRLGLHDSQVSSLGNQNGQGLKILESSRESPLLTLLPGQSRRG